MCRDPEPEQGCPGALDASKAFLVHDQVVLQAVKSHHLGTKEQVGDTPLPLKRRGFLRQP